MSIKSLEGNLKFQGASEKSLNSEYAAATSDSVQFGWLFYSTRAEVVDSQEALAARDAVEIFNVEKSRATVRPFSGV